MTLKGVQLKAMIDRVVSDTKRRNIIIIAHSMGGLAARAYIQNERTDGDIIINKLITSKYPSYWWIFRWQLLYHYQKWWGQFRR